MGWKKKTGLCCVYFICACHLHILVPYLKVAALKMQLALYVTVYIWYTLNHSSKPDIVQTPRLWTTSSCISVTGDLEARCVFACCVFSQPRVSREHGGARWGYCCHTKPSELLLPAYTGKPLQTANESFYFTGYHFKCFFFPHFKKWSSYESSLPNFWRYRLFQYRHNIKKHDDLMFHGKQKKKKVLLTSVDT